MGSIDQISHTLGRLESKVDALMESHTEVSQKLERNSERLKEIEGYKSYLMGVVAVITLFVSTSFDFIKHKIIGGL